MILSNNQWYQSKHTSLLDVVVKVKYTSTQSQHKSVVAWQTRPNVLYNQAKVALDSLAIIFV